MRTAVALGVAPDGFWRLSLMEWRMLTETAVGTAPLGRDEFERLMATWPDGGME
ncbi:phage tail assembly chaperone [Brevundimonas staleyi]|uniref:Phage tail assembly chaperone n=1 Tax=Brevundimonas staleyi TaxID=74326 RepID=A0ABW0FPV8_9CAUL